MGMNAHMNDDQKARLRAVLLLQRQAHQRLFELQGTQIEALRATLDAVARTQDEMSRLFRANNDADDIVNG
jgi:hypothetical protein